MLLRDKAIKSIFWVVISLIVVRLLEFIAALVTTNLLIPTDFGLVAISLSIIMLLSGISDSGLNTALIQKQKNPEAFYNVAWSFEIIKSFVIFATVFFTAPLVSKFFGDPRLVSVLRTISISIPIMGLKNISLVILRKELDFKTYAIYEIFPVLLKSAFLVYLTFLYKNVWALVYSHLIFCIGSLITSYLIDPYKPRLEFNFRKFKDLFKFGKWVLLTNNINLFYETGLPIIMSKIIGVSKLGYYNRASVFSKKFFLLMSSIIWKIGFPLNSIISNENVKMKNVLFITLSVSSFLGMFLFIEILLFSEFFVNTVLTREWASIIPLMYLLSFNSFIVLITTPFSISFQSMGNPDINFKVGTMSIIITILMMIVLSPLYKLEGILLAIIIGSLASLVLCLKKIKIKLNISIQEFFYKIYPNILIFMFLYFSTLILINPFISVDSIYSFITYFLVSNLYILTILIIYHKLFKLESLGTIINIYREF